MKSDCHLCGKSFRLSNEEVQQVELGEIEKPDTCEKCLQEQKEELQDYSEES